MQYLLGASLASFILLMATNPMHWNDTSPMSILIFLNIVAAFIYESIKGND